ncbi:hypothetical protein Tco_0433001 [Tanacetum coccineum]
MRTNVIIQNLIDWNLEEKSAIQDGKVGTTRRMEPPMPPLHELRYLVMYDCGLLSMPRSPPHKSKYSLSIPRLRKSIKEHGFVELQTRCNTDDLKWMRQYQEDFVLQKLLLSPSQRSTITHLGSFKQRMQAARDRQKSYADLKHKTVEFEVGDKVMLKVIKRVGDVAYKLELPEELSRVHNTFHVSNLKKCHADEPLAVPLDGLHFDDKLQFVEEPIEITDREVKRLKRSRIPLVKVRWNSKRGPEFTWEREDQFRKKYPHLFSKTGPSSSAAS